MVKKTSKLSLGSRSLRYKLWISFSLMTILPILASLYLISYFVFPHYGIKIDVTLTVFATILISLIIAGSGFWVIKEVFDRIVSVSVVAKMIAAGEVDKAVELEFAPKDEVGDLGGALNQLTQRIRNYMDELKSYSVKTTEINLDIQKRVIVLSNLLQISSMVAQGGKLEDTLKIVVEKARLLASSEAAYLLFREEEESDTFIMRVADGPNTEHLLKIKLKTNDRLFGKVIHDGKTLIVDKQMLLPEDMAATFYENFKIRNTLAMPVYFKGKVMAVIGIGNTQEAYLFRKEDIELLDVFAKQVAIAVENDVLMRRVEKLEIKDALTDLYNDTFIRTRLQEEIRRSIAYQRPCSFIFFDIDNFKSFNQYFGLMEAETILKRIASVIKSSITEVDRAGRMGDDEFAVILPEKNKRAAQETAEEIRKRIEFFFSEEQDTNKRVTVSAGVSENPLDGIDAQELVTKARELVDLAKRRGRNRVVAFKEPPVCR